MEWLIANTDGQVRRAFKDGREYLVAPLSLIVPGVLPGSQGPIYYPADEIAKDHQTWNGMPLLSYHPQAQNGEHVSANHAGIADKQKIGFVQKPYIDKSRKGSLRAEGWFDVEHMRAKDKRILESLENSKPIELSTGLFIERREAAAPGANANGTGYEWIGRGYKPDHVAILPDQLGACSIRDGCGVLVNQLVLNSHNRNGEQSSATIKPGDRFEVVQLGSETLYRLIANAGFQPSDRVDSSKACQILHDDTAQGHPLTDEQRKMFGAACSHGGTRNELTENTWSDAAREAALEARRAKHQETDPWRARMGTELSQHAVNMSSLAGEKGTKEAHYAAASAHHAAAEAFTFGGHHNAASAHEAAAREHEFAVFAHEHTNPAPSLKSPAHNAFEFANDEQRLGFFGHLGGGGENENQLRIESHSRDKEAINAKMDHGEGSKEHLAAKAKAQAAFEKYINAVHKRVHNASGQTHSEPKTPKEAETKTPTEAKPHVDVKPPKVGSAAAASTADEYADKVKQPSAKPAGTAEPTMNELDAFLFYNARWDQEARDKLSKESPDDFAGPHQSFPIRSQEDVNHAAKLIGHADDPEAVKGKVKSIAKRKGLSVPDSWKEPTNNANPTNPSTPNKEETVMNKEQLDEIIANCQCAVTKAQLVAARNKLAENAKKKADGKAVDSDIDDDADDGYSENDTEMHAFDGPKGSGKSDQAGGAGTKDEYPKATQNAAAIKQWLKDSKAPPVVHELINNSLKMDKEAKFALVQNMVRHIKDDKSRNALGRRLMEKGLGELRDLALIGNRAESASQQQDAPSYFGNNPAINNGVPGSVEVPVENNFLAPTIDYKEIASPYLLKSLANS